MAEYIKREALRKVLENWRNAHADVDDEEGCGLLEDVICEVDAQPAADVAPVVHGRCPICSGRKILTQDCYNGYSVEVDAEQGEMSIWQGDTCLTVISIDYCPNCGARMME